VTKLLQKSDIISLLTVKYQSRQKSLKLKLYIIKEPIFHVISFLHDKPMYETIRYVIN